MSMITLMSPRRLGPPPKEPRVSVEATEHGWIVRVPNEPDTDGASLRLDRVVGIYREAARHGLHWIDTVACWMIRVREAADGIEDPRGHAWVVIAWAPEAGFAWRRELEAQVPADLSPLDRWFRGPSSGMSSRALAFHLTGKLAPGDRSPSLDALPRDAEDFERCVSLLRAVPELRDRLTTLTAFGWPAIVSLWPRLEAALDRGDRARVDATLHGLANERRLRAEIEMRFPTGGTMSFPAALLATFGVSEAEVVEAVREASLDPDPEVPEVTVLPAARFP